MDETSNPEASLADRWVSQLDDPAPNPRGAAHLLVVEAPGMSLAGACTARFGDRVTEVCTKPDALQRAAHDGRYDLCIAMLRDRDVTGDYWRLLARVRNLFCSHIELMMLTGENSHAVTAASRLLFGLGFRRVAQVESGDLTAWWYRYELEHYNRKRGWNSPENWANPQNFDRYRW